MKVYTARQPVFNRRRNVVAYELLFRNGPENIFPQIDSHEATSKLLVRTELSQGIDSITGGKPALINFSEQCLLSNLPTLLPVHKVMIEILEDVNPSSEVLAAVKKLYELGYHIALDDFVYKPEWEPFFKYVKLIKFDIIKTPLDEISAEIKALKAKRKHIKILAEKVETRDEVKQAAEMGFDYFQGYFFCKPEMVEKEDIESNKSILLVLYKELLKEEFDNDKVVNCFEQDLNLTYKLLRFINSGVLPLSEEISSIKQALIYLGQKETRRLIVLLTTSVFAFDKPKELVRVAITRARFCELIFKKISPKLAESAFLTGLLSLLDALLDMPLGEILAQLPISDDISNALLSEKETTLHIALTISRLYEAGSWHLTTLEGMKISMSYQELDALHAEALAWMMDYYDQT